MLAACIAMVPILLKHNRPSLHNIYLIAFSVKEDGRKFTAVTFALDARKWQNIKKEHTFSGIVIEHQIGPWSSQTNDIHNEPVDVQLEDIQKGK